MTLLQTTSDVHVNASYYTHAQPHQICAKFILGLKKMIFLQVHNYVVALYKDKISPRRS